jgi:4'-phosphopantetheinyl transferase
MLNFVRNAEHRSKRIETVTRVENLYEQTWGSAPVRLDLAENQVHVWRAELDFPKWILEKYLRLLSPDELWRAGRYKFERDHDWYIARRGILRVLLSRYLDVHPETIIFSYSPYGKPSLSDNLSYSNLDFNISHSTGFALYGFGREIPLGIDIERQRNDFDHLKLAERFFSPYEINALALLSPDEQSVGFYHCWTRKEAFIKAHGEGLSLALDSFDVSLDPDEPASLLATRGDLEPDENWRLINIDPVPGFVGALAISASIQDIRYWNFD